jgi:DNA-binding SARP family transcriptional activator/tetratricopeptide (TPR) repeat protein
VEFGVLGTLLVRNGEETVSLGGPKLRALLATLLLQSNRTVSQDALVEAVWDGRPPHGALGTLPSYVMRLRRTLGAPAGDRVVTRPTGYAVELAEDEFDLLRFQAARAQARASAAAGDWAAVSATLTIALGLWRGEPLADVPVQAALRDEIAALNEARLQVYEQRIAADLELGRHQDVLLELRELSAQHTLHEAFRGQLMLALYRSGRQAEALTAYRDGRRLLIDELGIEPTPQLQELHERILNGDPALSAPTAEDRAAAGAAPGAGSVETQRPKPIVPRQLPRPISHFTGRVDELAMLAKLTSTVSRASGTVVISAIAGTGGVGKTALAVYWGHQVADQFADGQLYVNLRGFDPQRAPVEPDQAVRGFLDAFGVPPGQVPAGLEAQAAMFRSLMADRRVLVVLDNARDAEQVRPLLPGNPDCLVLVTSRNRLASLVAAEGAVPVPLDILSVDEARELLGARLGESAVAAEDTAARALIELCGRLPLALNIAASHVAFQREQSLADLVAQLRELDHRRLDALNAGDAATDVRAVFACSYQSLSAPAARLFRLLGLHPGADFTAQVAESLTGLPADETAPLLDELIASSLLSELEAGRFVLHDLLRTYAQEQCEATETAPAREAALSRLLAWYLDTLTVISQLIDPLIFTVDTEAPAGAAGPPPFADLSAALAWCDAEQLNLVAAVADAAERGIDEYAWRLAVALQRYYNRSCRWADWRTTHEAALVCVRAAGNRGGEGMLLISLGTRCVRLQEIETGRELLRRAEAIMSEVGDRRGAAMARAFQGNAHMMVGEWEQAAQLFRAVLDPYRESGYKRGEGVTLANIAVCLQYLERWDEAESAAHAALEFNSEFDNFDSMANCNLALMKVAWARRDMPSAFEHAHEAMRLRHRMNDRFGQAWVHWELAECHLADDDPAGALAEFTKSHRLFTELDPKHAALALDRVAEVRAQLEAAEPA